MAMQLDSVDARIRHAIDHITTALRYLNEDANTAFARAAFESRVTAYGTHVRQQTILNRVHADLQSLLNDPPRALPGPQCPDQAVSGRSS